MLAGSFETALLGFNNVIRIRPDHAIAYYYAAICYQKLGYHESYQNAKKQFQKYSSVETWKNWIDFFNIKKDLELITG